MFSWNIFFQHCCHCGRMVFGKNHLCNQCCNNVFSTTLKIDPNRLSPSSNSSHFFVLHLGTYSNPIMSSWIKALKQGDNKHDFKKIALAWLRVRQANTHLPIPKNPKIIPSPSRHSSHRKDHAFCLASALSSITGWELCHNTLSFHQMSQLSQKSQRRGERLKREFILRNENQINPKNNSYIFIDDVVTTGGTAQAAFKALKFPKQFEVWCVAIQPLKNKNAF